MLCDLLCDHLDYRMNIVTYQFCEDFIILILYLLWFCALSRLQNSKQLWNQYEDRRKLQAKQSQDIGTFFEIKCKIDVNKFLCNML